MRTITDFKFRAWCETDDAEAEMIVFGSGEFDNGIWFDAPKHLDKYIAVMQFTGMQDVNGKDIYEGDILQWTSKFRDTDITTPNKRGQVKYNLQGCCYHINYELNGKHYYKELMATFGGEVYVMETVEIVGNVFETPELLNF